MDTNIISESAGVLSPTQDPAPVAVIAIHGVGRHASGASADAVADLLLSMGRENGPEELQENKRSGRPYSGFVATSIEVPLRRVESPLRLMHPFVLGKSSVLRRVGEPLLRTWRMFDERRGFLAEQRRAVSPPPEAAAEPHAEGAPPKEPKEPDRGLFAFEFMNTQLKDYRGELDRTFSTSRLEARRAPNSPAATVHLYDVHYSDLSKPEKSITAFFFSFYQLLFHLGSLSIQAVDWAEAENANAQGNWYRRAWRVLASLHATCIRSLVMFIPILNLVLLALGLCTFAEKIPAGMSDRSLCWIAVALFGVLGLIAAFLIGRVRPVSRRPFWWASVPAFGFFLGGLAGILISRLTVWWVGPALPRGKVLLLLFWLLAGGVLVTWVARKLGMVRRGAFEVGILLYTLNALVLARFLANAGRRAAEWGISSHEIAVSTLWTIQLIFGELRFFWMLFLGSAVLAAILGGVCVWRTTDAQRKGRARAALRSSRFTLSVSAAVFLIVTLALWSGFVIYATGALSLFDQVPHTAHVPRVLNSHALSVFIPGVHAVEEWTTALHGAQAQLANGKPDHPWDMYLTGLLLMSLTSGFFLMLLLLFFGLFLLAWMALPSVLYEIWPEWTIKKNITNKGTQGLGNWLSRGLDSTAIISRIAWTAIIVVPLVFGSLDLWRRANGIRLACWPSLLQRLLSWLPGLTFSMSKLSLFMIHGIGVKLAVSGAAVAALLLKSGTPILDTLLDVDNYLRTSPKEETPLARISERYASLLRYIAACRDPHGRPYSRLIIVAHSLGSMVSSELLRYLKRTSATSPDPELAPYGFQPGTPAQIPIFLFTMGSPLRQLLNRFFPHRYWWVSDTPDNSSKGTRLRDGVPPPIPPIPPVHLPDPVEAGVAGWINAYRSGDYIGRSLWIGAWLSRNDVAAPNSSLNREAQVSPLPGGSGNAAEMCIGIGAHTHYWDRTAPDIATALDRLITNPVGVFP